MIWLALYLLIGAALTVECLSRSKADDLFEEHGPLVMGVTALVVTLIWPVVLVAGLSRTVKRWWNGPGKHGGPDSTDNG